MKFVWKLLAKCFLVLLPFFVLWSYMYRQPLAYVDGETPYYIWNRIVTNTPQEKQYSVVVLGDSVANAAYMPEVLSENTINLALGGTTPMENYYTLLDWIEHNPIPEICYISFQDFHFQGDDTFWSRTIYAQRYNFSQNLEMIQAAIAHREPSILTEHYWLDFISYQMYLPNKYITAFMNASFNQRYQDNTAAIQANELHGGRYIARGLGEYTQSEPVIFDEFRVNPLFDEYYRKIIELCEEKGITPRIVKLPLPDNELFTDNYRKTFYEYYENMQQEYSSLTVDWFSAYPRNRFADASHMNSHGSLQFSTELKARYPEDFVSSEMGLGQIAAINDSIIIENQIEWILKWIAGKDYTVLIYDNRGVFPAIYEQRYKVEWGTEAMELFSVPVEGAVDPLNEELSEKTSPNEKSFSVWGFSGVESGSSSVSVFPTEETLMIQPHGQDVLPWTSTHDDMLKVAVIDNYNHSILCMKTFRYVDEDFVLV